jgi:DNA-binding IscR family transcriptional regulator
MVMKEVRDAIAKILDGTTLADVCERVAKVGRGPGANVAYSI